LESADLMQRHGKTSTIDAQGVHHYLHQRQTLSFLPWLPRV